MENPPKKFFRLVSRHGSAAALRLLHHLQGASIKDAAGNVTELRCTYDPATRGGNAPDGRKVKATIHWVSADAFRRRPRCGSYNRCSASPSRTSRTSRSERQSELARSASSGCGEPARARPTIRRSAGAVRGGRATSRAIPTRRPASWCSTAPSACATPSPRRSPKADLILRSGASLRPEGWGGYRRAMSISYYGFRKLPVAEAQRRIALHSRREAWSGST